jgi:hypothetical protein
MMKFAEVSAEVRAVRDRLRGEFGRADVLIGTQRVLTNHPSIEGADKDFYVCCTYRAVRHEFRQQVNNERAKSPPDERQLTLDGFDHLQQFYQVERGDRVRTLAIDEMTDDEIDRKAQEYDAMGRACLEHADELRRYKELRGNAPPPFHRGDDGHPPSPAP